MTKLEILEKFLIFLDMVLDNDKTKYDYDQPNAAGKLPGVGRRWVTPRELALLEQYAICQEIELAKNEVKKC